MENVSISLRELLEAGAHFGHQKARWDPRMKPYIFGLRGGVYIIDLQKTVPLFREALDVVRNATAQGKTIMFVGTKRQAQEIVVREAQRCEMFYIHQRWLGGLMTNWQTVKKSVERLRDLDNIETDKRFEHLTKKERLGLTKQRARLDHVLAGIKEMNKRPDIIFVVDVKREHLAIAEANKLGIPVLGLIDTNSDPTHIDFPIPANDDAIRSIELFTSKIADAVIEGRNQWRASRPERSSRADRGRRGAGSDRGRGGGRKAPAREAAAEAAPASAAPTPTPAPEAPAPAPEASAPTPAPAADVVTEAPAPTPETKPTDSEA